MDKGVTCEHLNKIADVLGKDLWQSKDGLACFDCGCPGPNLWICLQPDCHHVGCSEVKNDHSTIHQRNYPTHCVHMNVSTERIWCYVCEKEVHIRAALAYGRLEGTSPVGGSSARLGFEHPVAMNVSVADEDDEADTDYADDDDSRPKGLVGLQNMGNTCYMNAALQALSNTAPLTAYFLECAPVVAVLAADKKPGVTRAYQKLIKEMWSRKTRGYVVPNGILYGIRNVHPMFRGYHQHDTQEFLRCFMDQLHEELKEPVSDIASEDKLSSEHGDHQTTARSVHVRRRAASSGASDAPFFARMRRKSPAPSTYSEPRSDGYLRVHTQSECGAGAGAGVAGAGAAGGQGSAGAGAGAGGRHRRSASFAGTQQVYTAHTNTHFINERQDGGSESELSCSSEADERYETCSSGGSDAHRPDKEATSCGGGDEGSGSGVRYRSVVSDVFDGKLLSSVQCLICDRVSTRVETFQDLSLPIPSREQLALLRAPPPSPPPPPPAPHPHHPHHHVHHHVHHAHAHHAPAQDSWVWWILGWLRSWFYGPVVSLQDCLAAFFSADELKGDNMYSCSRCNKLRNGVKMSGVIRLPEVLCIHLKRFRHELMFSSKVGARVAFPLHHLDMLPYTHKDCTSKISRYSLCAVICHSGTAGGGHYTCAAKNGRDWYEFDDQSVTRLSHAQLALQEAYVLFYRKVNPQMNALRQKAAEILESTIADPNDMKFYISKQWINKFNTWAEPGPIDNSDFVCAHGGVRPDRVLHLDSVAAQVSQPLWEFLYDQFGGGPACSHVHECASCARRVLRLRTRRAAELGAFYDLHAHFQEQERPRAIYAISMHWFRQWQAFVRNKTHQPPQKVDNSGIVSKQEVDGVTTYVLKPGSDHAQLSEELWRFFTDIYGGGPEVRLRSPHPAHPAHPAHPPPEPTQREPRRPARTVTKYSESDREDYCAKSTSETNLRDTLHVELLQKNQSLQNINRRKVRTAESDEEVNYRQFQYRRHEPNGNYRDSDKEMDATMDTVRMENGVDHDDNDNPCTAKSDVDLPDMDSISLKSKPSKTGKVRKTKRRSVK